MASFIIKWVDRYKRLRKLPVYDKYPYNNYVCKYHKNIIIQKSQLWWSEKGQINSYDIVQVCILSMILLLSSPRVYWFLFVSRKVLPAFQQSLWSRFLLTHFQSTHSNVSGGRCYCPHAELSLRSTKDSQSYESSPAASLSPLALCLSLLVWSLGLHKAVLLPSSA